MVTLLKLQHVYKAFTNDQLVVKDFNLDVEEKEFIVLVGPSGCGKTTILRLIAGLEEMSKGKIFIDDQLMNEIVPQKRDIAYVFQNYALYPHMTIYNNMAFGLKSRQFSKDEVDRRIKKAAQMLDIEKYLDRKPSALSGGQRQRVALGRAIVRDAKVFLMDEPLSNLDAKLRTHMRTEIKNLHERIQATIVYVTHDQTEAMTMATRLVVMNHGEIQQVGTPKEVYDKPKNVFVGGFIGSPGMNFFTGMLVNGKVHIGQLMIPLQEKTKQMLQEQGYLNKEIIVGIRPEDFYTADDLKDNSNYSIIESKIETIELLGAENLLHGRVAGQPVTVRFDTRATIKQGQIIKLATDRNKLHFFDRKTKNRINLD